MARFRLSRPAEADVAGILAASRQRWDADAMRRYAALLAAAMRMAAATPQAKATRARDDLLTGLRSVHLRHVRASEAAAKVRRPVHVVYFRAVAPDTIEIVRVLHERMEPSRHFDTAE